ncbi:MAG TPA: 4Fe-4S dicluster domain-containing protein [Bryobacteraceae bacterium]|jgi:molybdopterin-containing oxidoreductase family iron-sulfur binding subunit
MNSEGSDLVNISGVQAAGSSTGDYTDADTRRRFLELMGASIALATGAGCTRPATEFLMPYSEPPENVIPGRPKYYATAAVVNGLAQGVIVESHLGRPTKVEGNPAHPASLGATNVHSQSCVLDLYDPARSKEVVYKNQIRSWDDFVIAFEQALAPIRAAGGQGLSILTETVISPTLGSQLNRLLTELPEAKWHQYDPTGPHSARAGAMAAFGRYVNTYYRLDRADVILSLDSDFLAVGQTSTRYAHDFAFGRRVRGLNTQMNRLYVVESSMTATGGKADHRLALKYSETGRLALELAGAIGAPGIAAAGENQHADWVGPLARDLLAHRGRSAILPGENQPPALHALCHAMNAALGNIGASVAYTDPLEVRPEDQVASLRELIADLDSGAVRMLVILGGNPVYDAPADLNFAAALDKASLSIHFGLHPDETSGVTHWHIPKSHFFESWGDARAFDGTVTIMQPLIEPLYYSHSGIEFLELFFQNPNGPGQQIVRTYWQANGKSANFDQWWRESVGRGLIADSALPPITPGLQAFDTAALLQEGNTSGLDLVFRPDPFLYDGRYASNAWLQELPKNITKLTWDNAVHVSPRTAERLHLNNQRFADIRFRGRSVKGSVWISPGDADDTVTIHLGYGRSQAGVVGNGAGFNAYLIRPSDALWYGSGLEIQATGETYPLATTQMETSMMGRTIIISKSVTTYRTDPEFVRQINPEPAEDETLHPRWKFTGYSWGMVIDQTACVNCAACVIACRAENNIPVVGKEQELFHRDMNWLRVDVYFNGDPSHPTASYQPVPCMQCENAPCEVVCPVQATVHSSDGLNDMVYNRCIGTRYCSNNCPYKVRRFNFLLYADWYTEQLKMQANPDVTVRSRGVMEKCTYCVQRIREAEIRSQNQNRFVRDGEIQTACQQVCPTRAITFGDMNNPSNEVSRWKREPLNYSLLAELNTRPHTTYLAELRNPNAEMPT